MRPRNTASKCQDFRVMPGFWLRTAGGRKARYNIPSAVSSLRIIPFRDPHFPGSTQHLIQINYGSGTVQWRWFSALTFITDPFAAETIATTNDAAFAATNPAAGCAMADRPLVYNGLGTIGAGGSTPPFSTYFNITRYYGLHPYVTGGNVTVGFAAGAGFNQVATSVDIYVGLYSTATGHYSNPVKAGTITTTGANGTITVSGLGNIKVPFHSAGEEGELNFVFYATIDGGQVPYLIQNSGLTGPFTVVITSATASLSITPQTFVTPNGWALDLAHQAPINNFPPRPMRSVCFVNGRLYGCLMPGGSGTAPDFTYVPETKDTAAVVWSRAAGDSAIQNIPGDPNQCWPLTNIAYTPSSDAPIAVVPAQDNVRVLVLTPSSTFLLQEVTDGIHEYITISRNIGLGPVNSVVSTPYGICWVTQKKEFALLPPYSTRILILSDAYRSLITGNVTAADWIYDHSEMIDRYQVWMDNGISVIHDFGLGQGDGSGEAYTRTNQPVVGCAGTTIDQNGIPAFIIAGTGFYTHETQPDNGLIPTTDQTFTTGQSFSTQEISGEYDRNWDDFGASDVRKELPQIALTADAANSTQLAASPLTVQWYADFEQVTGANTKNTTLVADPQGTPYDWLAKVAKHHRQIFKIVVKLAGHHTDDTTFANHINMSQQGDLAKNFYGSVLHAEYLIGPSQNR